MNYDVQSRLPAEISTQLSDAEREELAARLAVQDQLAAHLRTLPHRNEEPSLAVSLERER